MKGEKEGQDFDAISKEKKKVYEENLKGDAILSWLLGVCCKMSRARVTG